MIGTHDRIRWMIRRDMPEVVDIEWQSFEYFWTQDDFLRTLRGRNCIGMVHDDGEKVIAFMVYELHPRKLELLNFAVHPNHRRRGVGREMVDRLKSKLASHRRTRIVVMLREANTPAQLFFAANDFRAVRVERGYYEDSGEDAYRFVFRL